MRRSTLASLASFAAFAAWAFSPSGSAQDVLHPARAFPYTLQAEGDQLRIRFDIVDGYYLYRSKFAFGTPTPGVTLGAAEFPQGEIHSDEFFGEQEIYRGGLEIALPYARSASAEALELEVRLQGCADIGLCYPPQRWTRSVRLPAADALLGAGSGLIPDGEDDLLPVDEAFVMNARFDGPNELTVSWQIEPGYYLYRDKLEIEAEGDIELGTPVLPEGVPHYDENFGDVEVFYDQVDIVVPLARASPDALPVEVRAAFQGCRENDVCYPPGVQTMSLTLAAADDFAPAEDFAAAGGSDAGGIVSEQDRLARLILGGSWPLVAATFFGLGLLLAFTPCVLPMVPILSGIIAGHGNVSTQRGFALSVAYVLGMAVTYTTAGALAALAGEQIQAIFQKPWIISVFAGLFVVLALSMFGVFNVQVPSGLQTRVANLMNRQRGGTFVGTAVIGALSALIVTTCVAPPLVATLAVIGQTGDVVRGAGALFALSLGMGAPLLLVGASAGKLLPKAGPWMNAVKAAFGVMMLGLAIWMLDRVLPGTLVLVLWSLLVFLTGVFLGAFEPLPAPAPAGRRFAKGLGMLACLYGALMLIGATLGGENPLRPIPQLALQGGGAAERAPSLEFEPIETLAALDGALAAARQAGRPVMVDFSAEWCVSCKEMEHYTFPDPAVIAALEPFALLRIDVTDNDDDDKALLKRFNSFGPPTIAFFDASGQPLEPFKLVGFVRAEAFAEHVNRVAAL